MLPKCKQKQDWSSSSNHKGIVTWKQHICFVTNSAIFVHWIVYKFAHGKGSWHSRQCDQIRRFFALWATIQGRWQQLLYSNRPHYKAILAKVTKSIIFLVKSFWATFIDIWRFLSGHTDSRSLQTQEDPYSYPASSNFYIEPLFSDYCCKRSCK